MARRVFVTGTGTGVGKTVLTVLLVRYLRSRGIHALAMKPFASGSPEDTLRLSRACEGELSPEEITPIRTPLPVAPLAGMEPGDLQEGVERVLLSAEAIAGRCEVLLIEGIGGLEVPVAPGWTVCDLLLRIGGLVLVAGSNRLGILNEVALTQHRLRQRTGRFAPVVLMQPECPDASSSSNPRTLRLMFPGLRVWLMPWLASAPDLRVDAAGPALDRIWEGLKKNEEKC